MNETLTYGNDATFKDRFLIEIGKHEAQDALIKGTYGKMNGIFKGCAIGCSIASLNVMVGSRPDAGKVDDHNRVAAELGWPLWLAYLEDNIFERLPDDLAKTWPRRLAEAIPVGVTVPDVALAKILRWSLVAETYGCIHATDDAEVKDVVARMGALFDRSIAGTEPTTDEWDEAAWAARDARDAWDARAARDAWAARATRDARDAWDAWAARAAWAARDARAARDAFYPALSEEVLRLLRELEGA